MADTKISDLTAAATLTGTELVPVVQGAATVQTTTQDIADLAAAASTLTPVRTVSGTSDTLVLADHTKVVRTTGSSAVAVTIPTNASVALAVGSVVTLRQAGSGALTLTAAGGVTLNTPTGHTAGARAQGSTLAIHKVATDEWDLTGDLA